MSFRDIPIDDLELSVRSANALKGAGYTTLGSLQDLFEKPKTEVIKTLKHFGAKSYWEVYDSGPAQEGRPLPDRGMGSA